MKKSSFILLIFLLPLAAHAYTAELMVDVGRASVNALEAVMHVPRGINIQKIYDGNSTVLIWVKSPTLDSGGQTISFSGITPGGFSGERMVFSISGEMTEEDLGNFTLSGVSALLNDGSGTAVPVRLALVPSEPKEDDAPPETFDPIISASPDLFEGNHFMSFVAHDKGTGVERYEYLSSWFLRLGAGDWQEISSPLILSHPMLFQKIYIRAIDHAGNSRMVSTAGPYRHYLVIFGVIILLCVLLSLRRSFHFRSSSSY